MSVSREQLTAGDRVSVKVSGRLTEGTYEAWSDQYSMPLVRVGPRLLPRKIFAILNNGDGLDDEEVSDIELPTASIEEFSPEDEERLRMVNNKFDINLRFQFIEKIVTMIAKGPATSLVVTGQGGLGKSFTVFNQLHRCGLEEERDYVTIKGYSTPKSLYRSLYENQDRVIVFDDCDSVLDSPTTISILKSTLDTMPQRSVSWLTEHSRDDIPGKFTFSGKVIFISNRPLHKVNQAILSRALYVDVTMTLPEKIERIKAIAEDMCPDVHSSIRDQVIKFLDDFKENIHDLNLRTFLKVINVRIYEPSMWREVAEYIVTA